MYRELIGGIRDTSHLLRPPLRSPPRFSDQAPFQFRLYPPHKIFATQRCPPPRAMSQAFRHPRGKRLLKEADIVPSVLRGKELLSQHGVRLPIRMGSGAGAGVLFRPILDAGTDRMSVIPGTPQ